MFPSVSQNSNNNNNTSPIQGDPISNQPIDLFSKTIFPNDIVINSLPSFLTLATVSKRWRDNFNNPGFWKLIWTNSSSLLPVLLNSNLWHHFLSKNTKPESDKANYIKSVFEACSVLEGGPKSSEHQFIKNEKEIEKVPLIKLSCKKIQAEKKFEAVRQLYNDAKNLESLNFYNHLTEYQVNKDFKQFIEKLSKEPQDKLGDLFKFLVRCNLFEKKYLPVIAFINRCPIRENETYYANHERNNMGRANPYTELQCSIRIIQALCLDAVHHLTSIYAAKSPGGKWYYYDSSHNLLHNKEGEYLQNQDILKILSSEYLDEIEKFSQQSHPIFMAAFKEIKFYFEEARRMIGADEYEVDDFSFPDDNKGTPSLKTNTNKKATANQSLPPEMDSNFMDWSLEGLDLNDDEENSKQNNSQGNLDNNNNTGPQP